MTSREGIDGAPMDPAAVLESSLIALFEQRVPTCRGSTAVTAPDGTLTFGELDRRANGLAHHLQLLGVRRGDRVAVRMTRGADAVVALFAVLKAGAAYVPIDPRYPETRQLYVLEDSQASVVLTQTALLADLPRAVATPTIAVDDATSWSRFERTPLDCATGPEDPVYVLYTSGSTGRPKGVIGRQVSTLNRIAWSWRAFPFREGEVVAQNTTLQFVDAVWQIFAPLLAGVPIVVIPDEVVWDPRDLVAAAAEHGVTRLVLVPGLLDAVLEIEGLAGRLPGLWYWVSSGETLRMATVRRFQAVLPGASLINLYGSSEVAADVTWFDAAALPPEATVVPLGYALDEAGITLVDEHGDALGPGVVGEILVTGPPVAIGYHNMPEATAERFFADADGAPGFRTGDLGRWDANGLLEYHGRRDDQVKIRGNRVELGEVENVLRRHPGVTGASVALREIAGAPALVAYVVSSEPLDVAALRSFLRSSVPEYMIPAGVVPLARLPLTPNGKVDRKALPPLEAIPLGAQEYVAPNDELERSLAGLFEELLDRRPIGITDDFFALGGHSLLAARASARVEALVGARLSVRDFFDAPTVELLAARVRAAADGPATAAAPAFAGGFATGEDARALSLVQQRVWLYESMRPDTPVYNLPLAMRLRGPLDLGALEGAVRAVTERHATLRSTFATGEDEPYVRFGPAPDHPLAVVDLSDATSGGPPSDEAIDRVLVREAAQRFDLGHGPLLRTTVYRLGPDDHVFHVVMHHIISDGLSIGLFCRELSAYYGALVAGTEPGLPDLAIDYQAFAAWDRRRHTPEAIARELAFWRDELRGAPRLLDLPTDRARRARNSMKGGHVPLVLSAELARSLRTLAAGERASLFMVLLAAFQGVLGRQSGQDEVLVGAPMAGRFEEQLEQLVGIFINTLVLRGDISGDPTFRELLQRTRTRTLGAYDHQDIPFEELVEEVDIERREGSFAPWFQALFVLEPDPADDVELPGLRSEQIDVHVGAAMFDVSLYLVERRDGSVKGFLEYNSDIFEAATVTRLTERFVAFLTAAAAQPDAALDELLNEGARTREQLGAARSSGLSPSASLVNLFEHRVARCGDAPAVLARGATLSFAELDRRANGLARHLQSLGVGPGDRVAVRMERGADAVVAIFAALKAGAVYVPIDPRYPEERQAYALQDSGAAVVLTQRALAGDRAIAAEMPVIAVDEPASWGRFQPSPLGITTGPDDPIYLLYTSGSTGTPKGVLGRQAGTVNRIAWGWREHPFGAGEVVAQKTSLQFVDSVWELFAPLLAGVPIAVIPHEVVASPRALVAALAERRVTRLVLVPTLLDLLLDEDELAQRLPALWYWVSSGEPLRVQTARRFRSALPEATLLNLYGSTEVSADVTWFDTAELAPDAESVPLGRPLDDVAIMIVGDDGAGVPPGVAGEIRVGGAAVALGYHGLPEETEQRFLADADRAPVFSTGDLARWRADGTLEHRGRRDDQVKIRGNRVALGEVESVLRRHADVTSAAVVLGEVAGAPALVAYVVSSAPIEMDVMAGFLRQRLPDYMVPTGIVPLAKLPLTPSGKVDREALPPYTAIPLDERRYRPPTNELERQLVQLFEELLDRRPIGIRDDFFLLGGHSLLAARLFRRIEKRMGVTLPLSALLEGSTVEVLAKQVTALASGTATPARRLISVQPRGTRRPLFLLPGAGSRLLYLRHLAASLGADQPLYALHDDPARGEPVHTVPELATRFIEEMRTVQPEGPYSLSGFSFGGVVAFEMAQQLVASGETVSPLILLDTFHPAYPVPTISRGRRALVRRVGNSIDLVRSLPSDERLTYVRVTAGVVRERRVTAAWQKLVARSSLVARHWQDPVGDRERGWFARDAIALGAYVPAPYPGQLTFIWARHNTRDGEAYDTRRGWTDLAPTTFVSVPGTHATLLLDPLVRGVARQLKAILAAAQDDA